MNNNKVSSAAETQAAPAVVADKPAKRFRAPIYRVVLDRTGSIVHDGPAVCDNARTAAALFRQFIGDSPVECFVMMALDARRRAIGIVQVSVGTISASLVHPRECLKPAILLNACATLVCHNHPSGDQTPSSENRDVTRRLVRAGELIGIPLADHIILGDDKGDGGYFSFRENGLM